MTAATAWRGLLLPGDYLVAGMAVAVCVLSAALLWQGGAPDRVVIRAGGEVFATLPLNASRVLEVPGPLGVTVVEVQPGRARVARDPGLRQYCVLQGWLHRAGSVAICAPNQVSVSLAGGRGEYDALAY